MRHLFGVDLSRFRAQGQRPAPSVALKRVFFLHLPKCGGTSVDTALQEIYRRAGQSVLHLDPHASKRAAELAQEPMLAFRSRLLLYEMAAQGNRYISGHFTFSETAWQAFGGDWQFMTVLRDPVARWYSNYFYNRYKNNSDHFRISEPLVEFVESDRARAYGSSYVSYLAPEGEADADEAVARAITNLQRFPLVGLLEQMDLFTADCERFLGIALPHEHQNRNPRSAEQMQEEVSPELDARVRALCEPNRRIYDAAMARIQANGSWLKP